MPYLDLEDGLYLIRQNSETKGNVDHYGILDVGNRINHPEVDGSHPVVIHQTPPQITLDWLQDTGSWWIESRITDEEDAINRILKAIDDPTYDLLANNCEHVAKYIATGTKESKQLQAIGWVAGLVALVAILPPSRESRK